MLLKLFLTVTVIANLVVPERVIRYGPCCYDDRGNLNAAHFNKAKHDQTRIHGPSCCDPTEYQLRAGAPSQAQVEAHIPTIDSKAACIAEPSFKPKLVTTPLASAFRFDSHGPPGTAPHLAQSTIRTI